MTKQIFRKVALERISSPEQLDQLITVVTPTGWLVLIALGGLILTAVFWGIYGSIPTKVEGQGIFLRTTGVTSIRVQSPGTVTDISVVIGDMIEEGDIVARLRQDGLLEQIRAAQLKLKNLETTFGEQNKQRESVASIRLQQLQQDTVNLNQHIANLENQFKTQYALKQQQEDLLQGFKALVQEGIFPKSKVVEVENDIVRIEQAMNTLKLEIEQAKNQRNDISLSIANLDNTKSLEELSQTQQIGEAKADIISLQKTFAQYSQVISQYSGRVLEIPIKEGDVVNSGTQLILLEERSQYDNLEVIAYFSPLTGKQIAKNLVAHVSPTIVKREEFGVIEGVVTAVDQYPSTFAMVVKTLQNDTLAQMLTQNAAPIRAVVRLQFDNATPSGYKWTSKLGPPIRIDSGTLCQVSVAVKQQAPITLAIPALKKLVFGDI